MSVDRFAYANDFLEHLNFALGEPTARGLNTLVAVDPGQINTHKLLKGFEMASEEEMQYQRARQADPSYQRQLTGWIYADGLPPIPRNPAEYERALKICASLSSKDLGKLLGGYGGERGAKPTGQAAIEEAADTLYNASYGIDTLTNAPLDYKHNAGHLAAFATHGQGQTRPEQARVNKTTQESEGMEKLLLIDDTIEDIKAARLYANHPQEMETLLAELPSSNRETKGWNPELTAMRGNAKRWHMM